MRIAGVLILGLALLSPMSLLRADQPIIDVHLHVYGDNSLPFPPHPNAAVDFARVQSRDELIATTLLQMDKHNIVLGLLHDTPENIDALNRISPERFRAYPQLGKSEVPPGLDEYDEKFDAGEWSGIGEILTVYNGLQPDDASLWPYYEVANRHNVPVFWHTGGSFPGITRIQPLFRLDYGRPLNWENVLVKYPDLRVALVHAGYPFLDEMMAILRQYPSVFVDTGAIVHMFPPKEIYRYFGTLIDAGFGDRILFGSDQMGWPDAVGYSVEIIMNSPWDESVKRNILYNNAARFLRLSDEQIAAHHNH